VQSASEELAYAASFLVLPVLGGILAAVGLWRLRRRLAEPGRVSPRYDIVLPGSRSADGKPRVIDGVAVALLILGFVMVSSGVLAVVATLTAEPLPPISASSSL